VLPVRLKSNALGLPETLGQSIANIAPTLTPALNVTVVAGFAGVGSWISYLIATLSCILVGACISLLARRHPEAGSYLVYIGRNLGPIAGALAAWAMILAYLTAATAVVLATPIFLANFVAVFGVTLPTSTLTVFCFLFLACVTYTAYRDVRISSRIGLMLECASVSVMVLIAFIVVAEHGTIIDPVQLDIRSMKFDGVMSAMAFAVFSFVGFESAATLAKESRKPRRNIPLAVMGSIVIAGLFFTMMTYLMVMSMDDQTVVISGSSSPFTDMTAKAGLPWAAAVVYFAALISAFAAGLACINASARLLFSMGRYQFLHGTIGQVHVAHQTPHVAVIASSAIIVVLTLVLLPSGFLDGFGLAGTMATYGFVVVYLAVCIAAPRDLYRTGVMRAWHVVLGVLGSVSMAFVIYGSVQPYPLAPFNILPPIFACYLAVGLVWFSILKVRSPQILAGIAADMEG
jgi:amino acid transporter